MTTVERTIEPAAGPRWKAIRDELCTLLPEWPYGSTFLSIADICKRFDVSTITARRVLNELEAEGLVEKIRGRGTVVRRMMGPTSIRLVIPSGVRSDYITYSAIMRRLMAGISDFAQQYHLNFDTTGEAHLQTLFARRHDDFGLLLPPHVTRESIAFVRARKLPHVLLSPRGRWKRMPHARPDRYQAGFLAVQYLVGLGHRRIAYLLGAIHQRNFRDRLRGYRDALRAADIPFRWSLVHQTDGRYREQDEQALDDLLALRSPPTAIITADDDYRAIHVLESLRKRGIKVPEQISVLGYPNCPDSELTDPSLSVVDANYEQVGGAAIRLLLSQMHEQANPAEQATVIAPKVVERDSTAPPPRTGA